MGYIKNVLYISIIVFVIINLVVNKELRKKIDIFLNKKMFKTTIKIKDIVLALIIVAFVIVMFKLVCVTYENVKVAVDSAQSYDKMLKKNNSIIEKQNQEYTEIMNIETNLENCKTPYIPEGFKYIEGTWDTGFVVKDDAENEFVWIPCTNIKNDIGIPIIKKNNFISNPHINYFYCYEEDESYKEFLKSSLENGGFYVSRYEIAKDENSNPISQKEKSIWTNIDYYDAKEISKNMYDTINSSLINGYAYDNIYSFIYDDIKDVSNTIKSTEQTGTKSFKNIYDIFDDRFEMTSEFQFGFMVYRGNLSFDEYGYKEFGYNDFMNSRFSAEPSFTSNNIGFRIIIYK